MPITKKRFGQHFLTDQAILRQLQQTIHLQHSDNLVEIGPGQGALTDYLLEGVDHLTVIEIDRDLIAFLQQHYAAEKLTVIHEDVLNVNFAQFPAPTRVVGNLPYNISTPLLFHLYNQLSTISDMHFMLQKEVAERICAAVGSAQYGRLSVMSQYFCEAELLFEIPPEAFSPPPKVDSAFIRLTPTNQRLAKNITKLQQIVSCAFNQRRKTLNNSIKSYVSAEDWQQLGIDPTLRAQNLSVEQFVQISNYLSDKDHNKEC